MKTNILVCIVVMIALIEIAVSLNYISQAKNEIDTLRAENVVLKQDLKKKTIESEAVDFVIEYMTDSIDRSVKYLEICLEQVLECREEKTKDKPYYKEAEESNI